MTLRLRALGGVLVLVAAFACGTPGRDYVSDPGPYDRVQPEDEGELRLARLEMDAGLLERARVRLRRLALRRPLFLPGRVLLQDVELALLERGGAIPGVEVPADADRAARREALRARYQAVADARPDAVALVLAARVETDPPSALRLLDQALEADPGCIWAHYGKAHVAFANGDFEGARRAADAALELDSGHLPTWRLDARLLSEGGEAGTAVRALSLWLGEAAEDPSIGLEEIERARLDLAIQLAKQGEGERALDQLEVLAASGFAPDQVVLVRAAVLWDLGLPEEAAAEVREALELAPEDPLALRQWALVLDRTDAPLEERVRAWRRALEVLDERASRDPESAVSSLLPRIQARVRLDELERAREEAQERPVEASP